MILEMVMPNDLVCIKVKYCNFNSPKYVIPLQDFPVPCMYLNYEDYFRIGQFIDAQSKNCKGISA